MEEQGGFLAQESTGRKVFYYLLGVAVFAVAVPLIRGQIPFIHQRTMTATQIGAELEGSPQFGEAFVAFKANYPAEYQGFLDRSVGPINRNDAEAANRAGAGFMQQFMRSKLDGLTSAPSNQLHAIAQEYSALIHVLKTTDTNLCARLVMTGMRPGDRPAPAAMRHLARITALQITAAHAAETSGARRRPALTERDQAAWIATVGEIDPAIPPLLARENGLAGETMALQCNAGAALYDAAAELPVEPSANVTAHLLRTAMGPGD